MTSLEILATAAMAAIITHEIVIESEYFRLLVDRSSDLILSRKSFPPNMAGTVIFIVDGRTGRKTPIKIVEERPGSLLVVRSLLSHK